MGKLGKGPWLDYIESFIAAGDFSLNTERSYRTALARFVVDVNPGAKGWTDRCVEWKSTLLHSLSPSSVSQRITCVRSFLQWCDGMGYVDRNPMLAVKVRTTKSHNKRALTNDEVRRLLVASVSSESLVGTERAARDRAALSLMLHTGLRITGARMLDLEDFKPRGDYMLAYYIGKGHVGKDAFVVVPKAAVNDIKNYLDSGNRSFDDVGPLFTVGDSSRRMSESGMRVALNRRFRRGGVVGEGITIHSLRHTAATRAIEAGAELGDVQQMLDHQSPATTEGYIHELNRMDKPAEMGIDYSDAGEPGEPSE